jgi:predicted ribosome quality control (RQC) complex YloA/Tae2 family protein
LTLRIGVCIVPAVFPEEDPDGNEEEGRQEEDGEEDGEAQDEEEVARRGRAASRLQSRSPASPAVPPTITDEERKRLLAEVRALAGAPLQKLWLPSAQVCVLQLRVPGRSVLVVVDARLAMAAVAEERPTAPESAPRSQATLRAALEGGRLSGAWLEVPADRREPAVRLEFGSRALIADQALILVEGSRIIWASSGAGTARRPGTTYPEARELELGEVAPLAQRGELVRSALQREEEAGLAARRREVAARLKSRAQKLRRTLAAVEEDAARAARAEEDLHKAELLLPRQKRIPRGAREARVQDWSRTDEQGKPAEVVIALDPALSAAQNAARWLRKAKRYQAAGARISARRAEVAVDLERAEELLARASSARDAGQLAAVEAALPTPPQRARQRCPHLQGRARKRCLAPRPRPAGGARRPGGRRRGARFPRAG